MVSNSFQVYGICALLGSVLLHQSIKAVREAPLNANLKLTKDKDKGPPENHHYAGILGSSGSLTVQSLEEVRDSEGKRGRDPGVFELPSEILAEVTPTEEPSVITPTEEPSVPFASLAEVTPTEEPSVITPKEEEPSVPFASLAEVTPTEEPSVITPTEEPSVPFAPLAEVTPTEEASVITPKDEEPSVPFASLAEVTPTEEPSVITPTEGPSVPFAPLTEVTPTEEASVITPKEEEPSVPFAPLIEVTPTEKASVITPTEQPSVPFASLAEVAPTEHPPEPPLSLLLKSNSSITSNGNLQNALKTWEEVKTMAEALGPNLEAAMGTVLPCLNEIKKALAEKTPKTFNCKALSDMLDEMNAMEDLNQVSDDDQDQFAILIKDAETAGKCKGDRTMAARKVEEIARAKGRVADTEANLKEDTENTAGAVGDMAVGMNDDKRDFQRTEVEGLENVRVGDMSVGMNDDKRDFQSTEATEIGGTPTVVERSQPFGGSEVPGQTVPEEQSPPPQANSTQPVPPKKTGPFHGSRVEKLWETCKLWDKELRKLQKEYDAASEKGSTLKAVIDKNAVAKENRRQAGQMLNFWITERTNIVSVGRNFNLKRQLCGGSGKVLNKASRTAGSPEEMPLIPKDKKQQDGISKDPQLLKKAQVQAGSSRNSIQQEVEQLQAKRNAVLEPLFKVAVLISPSNDLEYAAKLATYLNTKDNVELVMTGDGSTHGNKGSLKAFKDTLTKPVKLMKETQEEVKLANKVIVLPGGPAVGKEARAATEAADGADKVLFIGRIGDSEVGCKGFPCNVAVLSKLIDGKYQKVELKDDSSDWEENAVRELTKFLINR